ncbi:hypothetical protein MMC14_004696 [Varicellaria rhodocarpa]|nr:hypothetical protein [Varicellaria rhodocarpa]
MRFVRERDLVDSGSLLGNLHGMTDGDIDKLTPPTHNSAMSHAPSVIGNSTSSSFSQNTGSSSRSSQSIVGFYQPKGEKKRCENMKHFTCAFWARGSCKFSEEQCLYSHQHGCRQADVPKIIAPGCESTFPLPHPYRNDDTHTDVDPAVVHAPQAVISDAKSMASAQRPPISISTNWADKFREIGRSLGESSKSILRSGQKDFLRKTLTATQASDLFESPTIENDQDPYQLHGLGLSFSPMSEESSTHTTTEPSSLHPLLDPASAHTIGSADLEFSLLGPSLIYAINSTANMDLTHHPKNPERILLDLQISLRIQQLLDYRAVTLAAALKLRTRVKHMFAWKRSKYNDGDDSGRTDWVMQKVLVINHVASTRQRIAMEMIDDMLGALGYWCLLEEEEEEW